MTQQRYNPRPDIYDDQQNFLPLEPPAQVAVDEFVNEIKATAWSSATEETWKVWTSRLRTFSDLQQLVVWQTLTNPTNDDTTHEVRLNRARTVHKHFAHAILVIFDPNRRLHEGK